MPRKMKESGVEWLGQIPEGWEIKRFKYVAKSLRKGNGITKDEVFENGDLPCVRYGEIYSKYKFAIERCVSKTKKDVVTDPVLVSAGDILFACTGELVEEIGKNILYKGKETCVAGGDIMVASHDQNPAFLNYYLNCHSSQFQKSRNKTKLKVVHAKTSDIENLLVQIPTLPEQEQIAAFLDERCVKIDGMIAEVKASIEDYKKWKQAIVFEAVTGKLEKNLRPSGIEWMGDVPCDWGVERLQWHLEEVVEKNDPIRTTNILSLTNDRGVIPYEEKGDIGNKAKENFAEYKLAFKDTIVANSMNILIGSVGLSKYEGCVSPVYYVFKNRPNSSIRFFSYVFQMPAFQRELRRYANGILEIRLRVSASDILRRQVAIPTLSEQERIATFLDEKCAAIDKLVGEKEALIADLEAYKKSLIFETVTGKREVA